MYEAPQLQDSPQQIPVVIYFLSFATQNVLPILVFLN